MARDQKGASEVYYRLVKRGPAPARDAARSRAHPRALHPRALSRAHGRRLRELRQQRPLPAERPRQPAICRRCCRRGASGLPMAQTIWYIPTGLDIWNQKIAKAPGHYARGFQMPDGPPPAPVVHWPDQEPQALDGPLKERLGPLDDPGASRPGGRRLPRVPRPDGRTRPSAARRWPSSVFAGLIDVQDRSFHNRSYTTGHKSFRARATVELGEAIGWDDAHDVLYAGALDIAVGPRWYSLYEAASNAIMIYLEGQTLHAVPYGGTTEQERAILANNKAPLDAAESDALIEVILRQPEPAYLPHAHGAPEGRQEPARDPRCDPGRRRRGRDRDARRAQLLPAAALLRVLQHAGLVLGHVRASAADEAALSRRRLSQPGRLAPEADRRPRCRRASRSPRMPAASAPMQMAARGRGRDCIALDAPKAVGWVAGLSRQRPRYGAAGARAGHACSRLGNDPHNQEIALCMLEDFGKNRKPAPRPPAAGRRPAHRAAPQVRRSAGLQPPLRQGAGRSRTRLASGR